MQNRKKFSLLLLLERPPGFDRVRNAEIGNKDFELDVLEEAYTTEHWLVRIYKVSRCCPSRKTVLILVYSFQIGIFLMAHGFKVACHLLEVLIFLNVAYVLLYRHNFVDSLSAFL